MTQGQWWFYGFTPPLRGVNPINHTRISKPKNRVLETKPTVGLGNLRDPSIATNRRLIIMETNLNRKPSIAKLLRAQDVAELLSVSRSFAYALMQSGQLPTVQLGRAVRVRPEDLEEFIQLNLTSR
jgi:excisionase family DNA binding protein